jgi:hypothetical protein
MKKILLIAAVASMAAPAMASKARLSALGNAKHLKDTQTVFENPAHHVLLADYATFEAGAGSTTSNTANAEGGFSRSAGDAKYMFYLGRKSTFQTLIRSQTGFLGQENPFEIQYAMKGDINWGAGLSYSSSDVKSTTPKRKQNAIGIRFGALTDTWEAYLNTGLGANATGQNAVAALGIVADPDATMTGAASYALGGAYKMEGTYIHASIQADGAKYESSAAGNAALNGATSSGQVITVGVVEHSKVEGGQWFYGVSYQSSETKRSGGNVATDTKTTSTSLPFLLGLEYDAASWLALRASVTQNVLLGSTKSEGLNSTTTPASQYTGESDTIANNTTVAAGAGLKFNKWVVDGSLSAGTTGQLNSTSLMTNVALTYSF